MMYPLFLSKQKVQTLMKCHIPGNGVFHMGLHCLPKYLYIGIQTSAYYACCIYSNALQTYFIMEANTMIPDQTAPIVCIIGLKST